MPTVTSFDPDEPDDESMVDLGGGMVVPLRELIEDEPDDEYGDPRDVYGWGDSPAYDGYDGPEYRSHFDTREEETGER